MEIIAAIQGNLCSFYYYCAYFNQIPLLLCVIPVVILRVLLKKMPPILTTCLCKIKLKPVIKGIMDRVLADYQKVPEGLVKCMTIKKCQKFLFVPTEVFNSR